MHCAYVNGHRQACLNGRHEHMSERWGGLERACRRWRVHRKHIPFWQYKRVRRLDNPLKDINAFNVGRKRYKALGALAVWQPQAERVAAQAKSMQNYIDQLSDANSVLSMKLQKKAEKFSELSMDDSYVEYPEVEATAD